ncbi:MAG: thioredoxin domain-containing protein, partial [Deltaproteobacteria bacterium]|nr:thioredoxin domain-containing protein [Deltaproteobacteria bacterium]
MRKTFILFMALSAVFGCKKGGVQKDTGVYPWIGAEKPKVLVVAFMDYQCPNSAKLVSVLQDVLREFPDLVKVEFRNNPLNVHADSEISAAAALAAHNQGKFSEYYVKLFKNQSNLSEADLLKYAEDTGLDPESFKTDMKGERIKTLVARDKKIAAALAIQGTPHSFVNGRSIIGAYPLERFKAIVIEEIKKFDEMKNKGIAEDKIIALLGAERNSLYDRLVARNEEPPETQRQKEKVPVPDAVFHVRVEDDDPFEGNPQAPVTIVEFGNYLCPWTVKSGELISSLLSDYKGKVRFVFKQNPLDALKDAHIFSEAALAAASQGKFWEFHRVLFRNSGNLKQENLLAYAGEAGLDLEAFKTALEKKAFYERVEGDK